MLGIDKFSKNSRSESSILGLRIKFIAKGSLYYSKGQKKNIKLPLNFGIKDLNIEVIAEHEVEM